MTFYPINEKLADAIVVQIIDLFESAETGVFEGYKWKGRASGDATKDGSGRSGVFISGEYPQDEQLFPHIAVGVSTGYRTLGIGIGRTVDDESNTGWIVDGLLTLGVVSFDSVDADRLSDALVFALQPRKGPLRVRLTRSNIMLNTDLRQTLVDQSREFAGTPLKIIEHEITFVVYVSTEVPEVPTYRIVIDSGDNAGTYRLYYSGDLYERWAEKWNSEYEIWERFEEFDFLYDKVASENYEEEIIEYWEATVKKGVYVKILEPTEDLQNQVKERYFTFPKALPDEEPIEPEFFEDLYNDFYEKWKVAARIEKYMTVSERTVDDNGYRMYVLNSEFLPGGEFRAYPDIVVGIEAVFRGDIEKDFFGDK